MGSGWAYFVEQLQYEKHVRKHWAEKDASLLAFKKHLNKLTFDLDRDLWIDVSRCEPSTLKIFKGLLCYRRWCSSLRSSQLSSAQRCRRSSKGRKVHLPVDSDYLTILTKILRHCNMDYIVLSSLKYEEILQLNLSYDVICSWAVNFIGRMQDNYPQDLKLSPKIQIRYFIPKKHLPGHGAKCRTRYSFNWLPGVGRTHGETVEQEWSHINGAVLMTREMGSGARHAALDDHWGGWNWRKLVDMGKRLLFIWHTRLWISLLPPSLKSSYRCILPQVLAQGL